MKPYSTVLTFSLTTAFAITFATLVLASSTAYAIDGRLDGPPPTASVRSNDAATSGLAVDGGLSTSKFEVGQVNLNAGAPVEHTFTVRNTTGAPMVVSRVHPSCGCMSVSAGGNVVSGQTEQPAAKPDNWKPITLAPGQELPVQVSVDTSQVSPGPFNKCVFVYTDASTPAAVLMMSADATNGVTAAPETLDFGKIDASTGASLVLTVGEDAAVLGGESPVPHASSDDISIDPMGVDAGGAHRFRVAVAANAALGSLSETVDIVDAGGHKKYASIPVTGEVTGPLSASVDMIAFGAVGTGDTPVVNVDFTGPASTGSLSATSTSPYVTVDVDGVHLRARLSSTAPPGAVNGKVIVKTSTGTRLELPVAAFVQSKA